MPSEGSEGGSRLPGHRLERHQNKGERVISGIRQRKSTGNQGQTWVGVPHFCEPKYVKAFAAGNVSARRGLDSSLLGREGPQWRGEFWQGGLASHMGFLSESVTAPTNGQLG